MSVKKLVKINVNPARRLIMQVVQIVVIALSAVLAFLLRFDFDLPAAYLRHFQYALCTWVLVKIVVFRMAKLDRGMWEYVSATDILRVGVANVAASGIGGTVILWSVPDGLPR